MSTDNVCPDGLYGENCENVCPVNCWGGVCNKEIGFCASCEAGWQGVNCENECENGRYGKDCDEFCSLYCFNGTCNGVTGKCAGGCAEGFKPPNCVDECDAGFHGFSCKEQCSINCDKAQCDPRTGICFRCIPGFEGDFCDKECLPNYYGLDCAQQCNQNCHDRLCDNVNGVCEICPPGKMGHFCETECQDGTYGSGCVNTCSQHCKGSKICDKKTGACVEGCDDGYVGDNCEEKCQPKTYGLNCSLPCSMNCVDDTSKDPALCHHITGACLQGCKSGFEGDSCLKKVPGVGVGVVAGPVVALVILVAAVLTGIVLWRRSKKTKGNGLLDASNKAESSTVIGVRAQVNTSHKVTNVEENSIRASKIDDAFFNALSGSSKTVIRVEDLETYMMSNPKDFFVTQFKSVPTSSNASKSVGLSTENKFKNRYKNICAYDHSRVHLHQDASKSCDDYINASFITGYKGEKFIASQGPNKVMLEDFVRMLWEQQIEKVVMLTNLVEEGKPKCEMYWPENDEEIFGDIKIRLATTQKQADYIIRTLHLMKLGHPTQTATQFHFTSWPDKGVPEAPWGLVDFEQRVSSFQSYKPTVVHCSAGVGRTGTYIALHNVIKEAQDRGYLDFNQLLWRMRHERVYMIQTADQYYFLHEAARVALLCAGTTITSEKLPERLRMLFSFTSLGSSHLEEEFKAICSICAQSEDNHNNAENGGHDMYLAGKAVSNKDKNRYTSILPKDPYRPCLTYELRDLGEYINAVLVPSFTQRNQQMLTQLPLPNTVSTFWQLIIQYKVSLIVCFDQDTQQKDKTIAKYLPSEYSNVSSEHFGPYEIVTGEMNSHEDWEMQNICVRTQKKKKILKSINSSDFDEHYIMHLKCKVKTFQARTLLSFVRKVKDLSPPGKGRTIYMCRNGADQSGLVCTLSLLLDRMNSDHQLTVPLVVGTMKTVRPQVIPNLTQYRMLYQALKLFHDSNNVYCNGPTTSVCLDNDFAMDGGFDNEAAHFEDIQHNVTDNTNSTTDNSTEDHKSSSQDKRNSTTVPQPNTGTEFYLNNIDSRNSINHTDAFDGSTYYNINTNNADCNDEKTATHDIYSNSKVFISSL